MKGTKRRSKIATNATPTNEALSFRLPWPTVGSDILVRHDSPRAQSVIFTAGRHVADAWMAAALFAMLADPDRAVSLLAADVCNHRILSEGVAALREVGCDATGVVVREPSLKLFESADLVVTIGQGYRRQLLATTPQHRREHWLIPDALGANVRERARHARNIIRSRVAMLVQIEGWGRATLSRDAARVTRPRLTVEMLAAL